MISVCLVLQMMDTDCGLHIRWDGATCVDVKLSSAFNDKVEGLCANYNGNPNDEFKDKEGNTVIISSF